MAKRILSWLQRSGEDGDYLECPHCHHKISAKDVIFADNDISTCPFCSKKLETSNIDYENLRDSVD